MTGSPSAAGLRVLSQHADTFVTTLGDEKVLFAAGDQSLHLLNSTAALIWDCVATPVSQDELVNELADAFGMTSSEMGTAVDTVLKPLLAAGAVQVTVTSGTTA